MIDEEVGRFKEERKKKKEEDQEVQEAIKRAKSKPKNDAAFDSDVEMNGVDSDGSEASASTSRGRGRGRGRGSRGGGRGSRGSKGDSTSTRGGRGSRGGRGKNPVVEDSQRSIVDSFRSSGRAKTAPKKSNYL